MTRPTGYTTPIIVYIRAALARGPLQLVRRSIDGYHVTQYRFGRRYFNPAGVNALIAAGEAQRIGDRVYRRTVE